MKKILKYLLIAGTGTIFVSSCHKDQLYPIPQTSVADVSAFSTLSRIQSQVLALYGALKSGAFYGGRGVIYGDIKGDQFINETQNLVTGSDVWFGNPTNSATAITGLWGQAYYTINSCNVFLEGMASGGSAVAGAAANNYIAEAKLIRAICYYNLLEYYARPFADGNGSKPGVPLRLTAIKGAGFSDLVRSSVSDVYTQILKDLNDAEAGLPMDYPSGGTQAYNRTTRAHRNTAIALKTRVYLTMQNYSSVITEANKIVSATAPFTAPTGVPFALQADITKVFISPYTTTESILSMPMTTTVGDYPGAQNQLAYYFSPPASQGGVGNGEFSLNPNGIISDAGWTASDKRRLFIKPGGTKNWLVKYAAPSPYTDYVPVIRYAEVLLNLAEARVRSTNTVDAQAVALLNAVRNRSDASTTFSVGDFATPTDLINAILKERTIEFLGEGIRNIDLMRLLQTIPAKGIAPSKSPSDAGYIWPISFNELSLNHLCTDN
ncbi:MAG: RagB/SusD family nutrient uptake outer membrane protein [Bacteroidetes bacterium]|nr:RagB/SusD family nutrient uptake outer membrane protein [Bacteroidota bacterium]MBS1931716.1 RagB/SusD family nutrient uptake outer membrane protein [Bacteroidota bacterium]